MSKFHQSHESLCCILQFDFPNKHYAFKDMSEMLLEYNKQSAYAGLYLKKYIQLRIMGASEEIPDLSNKSLKMEFTTDWHLSDVMMDTLCAKVAEDVLNQNFTVWEITFYKKARLDGWQYTGVIE